jgi:S1-C subfamily serine protease
MKGQLYKYICLGLSILLFGCQPNYNSNALSNSKYNIFHDQEDHFEELMQEEDYESASELYNDEHDYFTSHSNEELQNRYNILVDHLNKTYKKKFSECESDIKEILDKDFVGSWSKYADLKDSCNREIRDYTNIKIIKDKHASLVNVATLKKDLSDYCEQINSIAIQAFPLHDHFTERSDFFDQYPCDLQKDTFFKSNATQLKKKINASTSDQLIAFLANYPNLSSHHPETYNLITESIYEKIYSELQQSEDNKNRFELTILANNKISNIPSLHKFTKNTVSKSTTFPKYKKLKVSRYGYNAPLQQSPSFDSKIIMNTTRYSDVESLGEKSENWVKVRINNKEGWFHRSYLLFDNEQEETKKQYTAPYKQSNIIDKHLIKLIEISNEQDIARIDIDDQNYTWIERENVQKVKSITSQTDKKYDFIIVVAPPQQSVSKELLSKEKKTSKFISDYIIEPNPQYEIAQRQYQNAILEHQRKQAELDSQSYNYSSTGYAIVGALLSGLSSGISQSAVNSARDRLANTSPTTRRPVYSEYQFQLYRFKIKKQSVVPTYLLDTHKKVYYSKNIVTDTSTTVKMQKGLRSDDENYNTSSFDNNDDISRFVKESSGLSLGDAVSSFYEVNRANPYDSQLSFLNSKKKSHKKQKVSTSSIKKTSLNSLIKSVVAIQDDGMDTIGTGFFVRGKYVLTNRHVVGDNEITTLKMYDGKTVLGRVIDKHYDLDIALIKVDGLAGTPVSFYSNNSLEAGDDVIAIGHPQGYEYTVTKGIVSAIRKMKDSKIPLSESYLHIQTDVPINHGNSGGPLFCNKKLVGMNTLKIVKKGVEGLGFAIHYEEIKRYLDKELP